MDKLKGQLHKAIQQITTIKVAGNEVVAILDADKKQFARLNELLIEYANDDRLIEVVMKRMNQGKFKLGDNAEMFFFECANEIFFENLANKDAATSALDQYSKMKKLHPLWGASWAAQ